MKKELSKIKKLDLRTIWNHEALDFTKWLAEEENLNILSETIGVDIKLIQVEANVGRYNVDILAEEENTGHKIIIENQLEDTNHDHLGKLITYASGHDAKIMIWVVKNAREEHIKAVEWLNDVTDETTNFFLINIEVWQIDNSNPAPRFEVLVRPNEWAKTIKYSSGAVELTNTRIQQLNFWTRFKDYSEQNKLNLRLRTPRPQQFYDIALGTTNFHIALTVNTVDELLSCEIYIGDNKNLYKYFESYRDEIEKKVGMKLEWVDAAKAGRIKGRIKVPDLLDPKNDEKNFEWLVKNIEIFKKVFLDYFKNYTKEN